MRTADGHQAPHRHTDGQCDRSQGEPPKRVSDHPPMMSPLHEKRKTARCPKGLSQPHARPTTEGQNASSGDSDHGDCLIVVMVAAGPPGAFGVGVLGCVHLIKEGAGVVVGECDRTGPVAGNVETVGPDGGAVGSDDDSS